MKILVYGAGNIGSLYAALLKESGQDVSILARGKRLADLHSDYYDRRGVAELIAAVLALDKK